MLVSPEVLILEQAVRLGFPASNNEAEYEVLVIGLGSTCRLGVEHLRVFCDSQLVANQISGEYRQETRECQPISRWYGLYWSSLNLPKWCRLVGNTTLMQMY